jgi:hypothetical protein
MEPVLQFDPAHLAVFYRGFQVEGTDISLLDDVARCALVGEHAEAVRLVQAIPADEVRARAANVLSAVWHEQRHFVDVLLTNFGQSIVRRVTSLLVNLPHIVREARAVGGLAVPVTVYGSRLKRRAVRVRTSELLERVAKDVHDRERLLAPDMLVHRLASGATVSIGGHAQLEALGYLAQMALLQGQFGLDETRAVQRDMPDQDHLRDSYEWAALMGASLDLVSRDPKWDEAQGVPVLAPAVMALLYGTLMIRRWGQDQTFVKGGDSGSAAGRMDPLLTELKTTGALAAAGSTEEAWRAVDEACGRVFGRTATEELEADLDREAWFCDQVSGERGADSELARYLRGLHEARLTLAERFRADPRLILDPGSGPRLLDEVLPVPVFVDLKGRPPPVPAGWHELWRGRSTLGNAGVGEWIWAAAPLDAVRTRARVHTVADPEAWTMVTASLIPTVKVLMFGRRQPAVLGPELQEGESMLTRTLELDLAVHPLFATPVIDDSSAGFWYLTGRSEAVCDGCSALVARDEGWSVPSAFFRQNTPLATWLVEHLGGGEFGLFMARRDWTGWLLCDRCHAEVSALAQTRDDEGE